MPVRTLRRRWTLAQRLRLAAAGIIIPSIFGFATYGMNYSPVQKSIAIPPSRALIERRVIPEPLSTTHVSSPTKPIVRNVPRSIPTLTVSRTKFYSPSKRMGSFLWEKYYKLLTTFGSEPPPPEKFRFSMVWKNKPGADWRSVAKRGDLLEMHPREHGLGGRLARVFVLYRGDGKTYTAELSEDHKSGIVNDYRGPEKEKGYDVYCILRPAW